MSVCSVVQAGGLHILCCQPCAVWHKARSYPSTVQIHATWSWATCSYKKKHLENQNCQDEHCSHRGRTCETSALQSAGTVSSDIKGTPSSRLFPTRVLCARGSPPPRAGLWRGCAVPLPPPLPPAVGFSGARPPPPPLPQSRLGRSGLSPGRRRCGWAGKDGGGRRSWRPRHFPRPRVYVEMKMAVPVSPPRQLSSLWDGTGKDSELRVSRLRGVCPPAAAHNALLSPHRRHGGRGAAEEAGGWQS